MSNPIDEDISRDPIRGSGAFSGSSLPHINSQVSQLLCIATALRGRDTNEIESTEQLIYDLEVQDKDSQYWKVPLPRQAARTNLKLSLSALTTLALSGRTFTPQSEQRHNDSSLESAYVSGAPWVGGIAPVENVRSLTQAVVEYLYTNIRTHQSSRAALALLNLATKSEHERVRVASMAALHLLHPPSERMFSSHLAAARGSSDNLVATLAEVAVEPKGDDADEAKTGDEKLEVGDVPHNDFPASAESLSITVHGTFARIAPERWYVPSEPLPQRIARECSFDLDQSPTYFRWSGQYKQSQRDLGARQLINWCRARGITCLDTVYAHSHGGNVVMDALKLGGIKVKLLVLMHVPVIPRSPSDWQIIESNVGWVFDLRTPHDWVVRLDALRNFSRNGFGYNLMCVTRPSGPVVSSSDFSHGHFIQDETWEQKHLTNEVNFERASISSNRKAANMGQFMP